MSSNDPKLVKLILARRAVLSLPDTRRNVVNRYGHNGPADRQKQERGYRRQLYGMYIGSRPSSVVEKTSRRGGMRREEGRKVGRHVPSRVTSIETWPD